jgi:hypothetical protein
MFPFHASDLTEPRPPSRPTLCKSVNASVSGGLDFYTDWPTSFWITALSAQSTLMNSRRVELLDLPQLSAQLGGLERRTARGGKDSIDHAPGAHDDLINAAAGALVLASGIGSNDVDVDLYIRAYGGGPELARPRLGY